MNLKKGPNQMHTNYQDILSLTNKDPLWFDERAVPRFCPFEPKKLANIYAHEACLLEIKCQACGHPFVVAMSYGNYEEMQGRQSLSEAILYNNELFYGDPPNIGCCDIGITMTSVAVRVLEFWISDITTGYHWQRKSELERELKEW